jgi:hypothetical protein
MKKFNFLQNYFKCFNFVAKFQVKRFYSIKINKPILSKENLQQSKTLNNAEINAKEIKKIIQDKIKLSGPIGIDQYMQICLYDKSFGYYTSRDHIFGDKGDFVTAPEFSQLFGEKIALFIRKTLDPEHYNFPKKWDLVEIGAGRGILMSDILRCLIQYKSLTGLTVHIVETSEKLIKLQQENINNLLMKHKVFTEYFFDEVEGVDCFWEKNLDFKIKWHKSIEEYTKVRKGVNQVLIKQKKLEGIDDLEKMQKPKENEKLKYLLIIN